MVSQLNESSSGCKILGLEILSCQSLENEAPLSFPSPLLQLKNLRQSCNLCSFSSLCSLFAWLKVGNLFCFILAVCVCAHVCAHVHAPKHPYVEAGGWRKLLSLAFLFFETGSLSEHRYHPFGYPVWSVSSRDPSVSKPSTLGL